MKWFGPATLSFAILCGDAELLNRHANPPKIQPCRIRAKVTKISPADRGRISFGPAVEILRGSAISRGTILLVAWLAVWQLGRLVEYTEHASVWFPVAGLTFAALLVLGRRAVLPIMVGAVLITIWSVEHYQLPLNTLQAVWAGILFGLAHIGPYWLGAALIARVAGKPGHSAPQLIVTFLLVAALASFGAAILVISSLTFTNQMDIAEVGNTLLPFWVGDVAGVVALAPMFSAILIRLTPQPNIDLAEFRSQGVSTIRRLGAKMALNSGLIVAIMLLAYLTNAPESAFAIFFIAVTHMWIACTESPAFNVFSLAVSSFLIALLVHVFGLMDHVMVYQFAINVIAANALFGIAIPQLRAHNEQLTRMVFTDALTGASSRYYMKQRASLEINQSHAEGRPLTLALFDLDNFKRINDLHGHTAGDRALVQVHEAARDSVRRRDVVARFGGDEFVILLPDLGLDLALERVEQIKASINRIGVGPDRLSSSFGIAELQPGEDFDALFQRADKALYQSKEQGKNRIRRAS